MSTLDLKNLWQQQSSSQPSIEEVLQKAKSYKKKSLQSIIVSYFTAIGIIGYLLFIGFYYNPELVLTKIGIGLAIIGTLVFLISSNTLHKLINSIQFDENTIDYIKKLKAIKEQQRKIQTSTISSYFILFSAGMGIYLFELLVALNPNYSIPFVIGTVIWIAINWFVFRPKVIKKQTAKIDTLIQYFGDLEKSAN
ncbi:hypothetical protein KMW28_20255 [Flammeovirga yaeyamensis]|uniref:Uncharacterized protein n=1 Tax=Flammeovirga yaeyamensis TaxID=367791 RepID=A0AAX1N7R3_9BACT|nr:hypothetical protein [Flammeovirga yaeyamensis]MBB3700998.1 hypothetical protein [Flammeovirga yaeyamensis]NMF38168.1 hypothetical protein [Flammeovirga yaeyamensis]QWG01938.1 hypothetical protein KMW28_20255 [Flammeovirga yaeyamensis]